MHRFFVDATGLSAEQRRQIATVLRLGTGEVITLVRDGEEQEYRLSRVSPLSIEGEVIATRAAANEPRVALTLALPLLRGDRTEEIVEATAQIGVSRFAPYVSARSVVRELSAAKRERWERIAREASETARRGRLPAIDPVRDWTTLVRDLPEPLIVAWEEEHEATLEGALPRVAALSLVIGPEGGLDVMEVAALHSRGAVVVSLGRRVLRAETAAIVAVARVIALLDP